MVFGHDLGDIGNAEAADQPCKNLPDQQLVLFNVVVIFELEKVVEYLLGDLTLLL